MEKQTAKVDYFADVINFNLDHAKAVYETGTELVPVVCTEQGHLFPMIMPDASYKQIFFQQVRDKCRELGLATIWIIGEAWSSPKVDKDEAEEVDAFQAAGGSLEFWPGSIECLIIEVCDGEHYQSSIFNINRDGKAVTLTYNAEESVPFTELKNANVNSNLTRIFQ